MEQKVSLGSFEVSEGQYKADLELMDRCQAYSAELIRLALLGVAGLGFIFEQLASSQNVPTSLKDPFAVFFFFLATILFLVSTAFGLRHRHYCWEAFWSHVRSIRCTKAGPSRAEDARKSSECRNDILKRSSERLGWSAFYLWCGGIAFAVSLWILVFRWICPT